MASLFKYYLTFALVIFISLHLVMCVELDVGGGKGWVTPTKNDQLYNDWASGNRFKICLCFYYKKDSVLVVTEEEYERCRSAHPMFFSNNGDTVYTLDRPGLFYFISGVAGHCERGLKMIVKVLDQPESPPQVSNQTASDHHKKGGAAVQFNGFGSLILLIIVVVSVIVAPF
ncbi:hypothetical protein ACJIZ3_022348 [Penstemon smallii]|uniref:Phytocyanin domain-containing protein n=1 Tax=Penstemon smallii TaxID=265156 RepID=A0ABD3TN33_9LAMI